MAAAKIKRCAVVKRKGRTSCSPLPSAPRYNRTVQETVPSNNHDNAKGVA